MLPTSDSDCGNLILWSILIIVLTLSEGKRSEGVPIPQLTNRYPRRSQSEQASKDGEIQYVVLFPASRQNEYDYSFLYYCETACCMCGA